MQDLCEKLNLQATQWFLEKIQQLAAMLAVRHGVMMIGEPMSGKTRAVNILAECLTTLADMKIPEQHEFKVNKYIYGVLYKGGEMTVSVLDNAFKFK